MGVLCQFAIHSYFKIFILFYFIYLSTFGFAGSSLLHRLFSSCGEWRLLSRCGVWTSRGSGFSCCGAWALGHVG